MVGLASWTPRRRRRNPNIFAPSAQARTSGPFLTVVQLATQDVRDTIVRGSAAVVVHLYQGAFGDSEQPPRARGHAGASAEWWSGGPWGAACPQSAALAADELSSGVATPGASAMGTSHDAGRVPGGARLSALAQRAAATRKRVLQSLSAPGLTADSPVPRSFFWFWLRWVRHLHCALRGIGRRPVMMGLRCSR